MRGIVVIIALAACGNSNPTPAKRTGSGTVEYVDHAIAIDGQAANGNEAEPNDNEDTASKLASGATLRGRMDTETDADFFALDVATAGVLDLELTGIEGVDLTIDLEDATGAVVAKSDRGAAKTREGLPNFPVAAGRYTAVVRAKKPPPPPTPKLKKGQKAPPAVVVEFKPSPVYEIAATIAPPAKGMEREPDDDRGAANELILGDPASGYIGWTGDVDAWKLSLETMSAKNAIDIEVQAPESVALTLEIADGVGAAITTRKGPKNASIVVRGFVPMIAAGAAPFHYLTIRSDRSNPETAYQIKVVEHTISPDAEIEPNDTPEKAMAMPSDRTTVKGVWNPGDVDCFVLETTDAERKLDVSVDVPNEVDLFVEILVDGKQIVKSDVKGKGAAEKIAGAVVPPKGRPVIRVRSSDASATGEGNYVLSVQEVITP